MDCRIYAHMIGSSSSGCRYALGDIIASIMECNAWDDALGQKLDDIGEKWIFIGNNQVIKAYNEKWPSNTSIDLKE